MFPPNAANIPDSPERTHWSDEFAQAIGAPAAFDYGPQRIAWCGTLVTNWMGDDARLKRRSVQLLKPNYHGNTLMIGGVVRGVDHAAREVTIDLRGVNQLDELIVDGGATVTLPDR